jgi:triacylglycerol lipase
MRGLILFVLLFTALPGQAKQLVLVQGYLSNSSSWSNSGIIQLLQQNHWLYGGEYVLASDGVRLTGSQIDTQADANAFYLVSLPTEASLQVQGYYLKSYLRHLRNHFPQQRLILVGHSAGGVLARYVMVQAPELDVAQLITIASPHLGTQSAELGKLVGESPLGWITPFIGAQTINRSQSLYSDLLPEQPHRFLFWLNRQPHPEAEYISIVRDQNVDDSGDLVVEQESQYLEHVYDLRERAYSYVVPAAHDLTPADGRLILSLIEERVLQPL